MKSPTKGSFALSYKRLLTWKAVVTLTMVLMLLMEWKRLNQTSWREQPARWPPKTYQPAAEPAIHSDSRYGSRQLLKKWNSNGGLSTTTAESEFSPSAYLQQQTEDDKSFGESGT